ncbi:MAG: ABC transporter ATP-binding protein [Bryobacteraceae bacterium]|nr:ABC transporter ATP-binding protein [Bryobacteraceae bacterium]
MSLLRTKLTVHYANKPRALDAVEFAMDESETLSLIGPSGSGKSTLGLALLGLIGLKGGRAEGQVEWRGRNLLELPEREWRRVRGREMALVPQSPLASLNPALRLGSHFADAWRAHATGQWRGRALEALAAVSLPADDAFLDRYPAQLSVGQAQRLLVALALLHRPALLIADEPTSALDSVTVAEVLDLFRQVNREHGTAILFISHDLLTVASLCQRVAILEAGCLVEQGETGSLFAAPQHSATQRLLRAIEHYRIPSSKPDAKVIHPVGR